MSATVYGPGNASKRGSCTRTWLCTVPAPVATIQSEDREPQLAQPGSGGCRSVVQSVQRWMRSSPAVSPSHQKAVSGVTDGRGRIRSPDEARPASSTLSPWRRW